MLSQETKQGAGEVVLGLGLPAAREEDLSGIPSAHSAYGCLQTPVTLALETHTWAKHSYTPNTNKPTNSLPGLTHGARLKTTPYGEV